ncbi:MAG: chloramphenicol phosphotransferase CPT family protein [Opitutales bacterium]|nr:chloramphenicol phosphotransferase CPT family protein [Opitutales bacterium]NRA26713.1 chloramphenicol phosphotransferase [Opitutales bacterium]
MIAIILNGTSSSGKSSIAKRLQARSRVPMIHASLDTFTDMFDWKSVLEADQRGCHAAGVDNFHRCLPVLASSSYPIVVDHVFEKMAWHEACFRALESRSIFFVGVYCPLLVLEERERARGDRRVGLARMQYERVHDGKDYDLELNTAEMSADVCAIEILESIER